MDKIIKDSIKMIDDIVNSDKVKDACQKEKLNLLPDIHIGMQGYSGLVGHTMRMMHMREMSENSHIVCPIKAESRRLRGDHCFSSSGHSLKELVDIEGIDTETLYDSLLGMSAKSSICDVPKFKQECLAIMGRASNNNSYKDVFVLPPADEDVTKLPKYKLVPVTSIGDYVEICTSSPFLYKLVEDTGTTADNRKDRRSNKGNKKLSKNYNMENTLADELTLSLSGIDTETQTRETYKRVESAISEVIEGTVITYNEKGDSVIVPSSMTRWGNKKLPNISKYNETSISRGLESLKDLSKGRGLMFVSHSFMRLVELDKIIEKIRVNLDLMIYLRSENKNSKTRLLMCGDDIY